MKWMQFLAIAAFLSLTVSCGGGQGNDATDRTAGKNDSTVVRPSEYVDLPSDVEYSISRIENEVFYDTGSPIKWDGRAINDARSFLSMSIGDICGRGECGKEIYLTNSNETQPVRTVVTVPFQIGNSDDYMAREYIVDPGEKKYIGCTHLCDGDNAVEFKRAIVVTELVNEVQ